MVQESSRLRSGLIHYLTPPVFPRFFRAGTNVPIAQLADCHGLEFDNLLTLKIATQSFFFPAAAGSEGMRKESSRSHAKEAEAQRGSG